MTKITQFNRSNIGKMRSEFEAAVNAVAKKYGIEANLGTIRFEADEMRCKLTVQTSKTVSETVSVSPSSPAAGTKAATVDNFAKRFGFKKPVYKREIVLNGSPLRVIDINPRTSKYPYIVEGVRAGRYTVSADELRDGGLE